MHLCVSEYKASSVLKKCCQTGKNARFLPSVTHIYKNKEPNKNKTFGFLNICTDSQSNGADVYLGAQYCPMHGNWKETETGRTLPC